MFGRSQLLDNTFTSSLSMPRLTLILSRLSEFRVAELSMNGAPWKVARSQRHSTGEYGRKSQPVSGSATYQLHGIAFFFCETKSYLRLIHSNVADVELTYPSLDVRGCQGLNIAKENMRLGAPYLLLQRHHRRARQGDKSYSQPCHISLNLGL